VFVIETGILDSKIIVFASGETNSLISDVIYFMCHVSSLVLRVAS